MCVCGGGYRIDDWVCLGYGDIGYMSVCVGYGDIGWMIGWVWGMGT